MSGKILRTSRFFINARWNWKTRNRNLDDLLVQKDVGLQ